MNSYDVIVIGGGHNGLVAAAYLARASRSVLVLERRDLVGGCAVTEEPWPGFKLSTAAYVNSLFRPEIIRSSKGVRNEWHCHRRSVFVTPAAAFSYRRWGVSTRRDVTRADLLH